MAEQSSSSISGTSLFYLLVCGGGLFAFVLLAIVPTMRAVDSREREIQEFNNRIARQKILFPAYSSLLDKVQTKDATALPFPATEPLDRESINSLSSVFGELGQRSNLDVDVIPDVQSLAGDSRRLLVNATAQGQFYDFRRFLVELGGLPQLVHLEELQIQAAPERKKFRLKFWLALEESS